MNTEIKPISPSDINIVNRIPSYVIQAVNELIKKYYIGKAFTINQDELIAKIIPLSLNESTCETIDKKTIFDKGYLDIEAIYNQCGWHVVYEKPYGDESFDAYFKFTPKKTV